MPYCLMNQSLMESATNAILDWLDTGIKKQQGISQMPSSRRRAFSLGAREQLVA